MKQILSTITCLSLATLMLSSCVSKKRYLEARNRADAENTQIGGLSDRVRGQQDTINALSGQVSALGDVYQSTSNQLNMSKEQVAEQREKAEEQRKRVQELEAFISAQQASTEALHKKIADALTGFNSNELTVTMKDGRVYVSMQESLLFPSGSAVVNPKGKDALSKLAAVLNTNHDINIDVEGHTDSVPIHNKVYPDNWALSTARATAIARVLIGDYGVYPARLVASGRSKYDPVATNETDMGRALNRRTEIILEPKLDELMELMDKPVAGSSK